MSGGRVGGTGYMSDPQEYLEGAPLGEGHYVRATPHGVEVEAFFVNPARRGNTRSGPDLWRGRDPGPPLEREELIFMLDSKQRDWRKHRASALERATVLAIGRKLEQKELRVSEFAKLSLGLTPRT